MILHCDARGYNFYRSDGTPIPEIAHVMHTLSA